MFTSRQAAERVAKWVDEHDRPQKTEVVEVGGGFVLLIYSIEHRADGGIAMIGDVADSCMEARAILGY